MEGRYLKVNINYVMGDATHPVAEGMKIIVHICNDKGKWGKGFVVAISKRWRAPEMAYRQSFDNHCKPALGDVQFITVEQDVVVANIIGQEGTRTFRNSHLPPPIRYSAVSDGLDKVADYALKNNASVHMPRIGCGLAGGRWEEVEEIIRKSLLSKNIATTVYDYD